MSFNSRSMSHLLCRSRMIAFSPSTFCRLGLTPREYILTVTFLFLFKRTNGVPNNSVPAGLPCSHGRDVHPSPVFLWPAVFAMGWHSPRPSVDCGKARPYNQLTTPAAAAYYRPPRGSNFGANQGSGDCYTTEYGIRALPTSDGGTACLHVCP